MIRRRKPMARSTEPLKRTELSRKPGKKARRDLAELRVARRALLERSRGYCEARYSANCSSVGTMAHHVKRRSQGGPNDPRNLLWVCAHCHGAIHLYVDAARELGLLA